MDNNLDLCTVNATDTAEQVCAEQIKFLTVDQFAKQIGVHPQTVRKWDNDGLLKAHHKTPSGRRLYTMDQVREYFNK